MVYIVIDGIISAGKSTFVEYIEKHYSSLFEVGYEPVDEWKAYHGYNCLDEFYKDINNRGLGFQLVVFETMLNKQIEIMRRGKNKIVLQDRYPLSGKNIFMPMLKIPEYETIAFTNIINKIDMVKPDIIVYLKCDVEIAQKRIMKRNRSEETNVSIEYQQSLQQNIEKWISSEKNDGTTIIELDGNKPTHEIVQDFMNLLTN